MDPISGIPALDWFLEALEVAGYSIVLFIMVIKNIFALGPVTPGEAVVVTAAFLSNPDYGSLSWIGVWIAAVTGTVAGSNISFFIGRRGGRAALLRYGDRVRLGEQRIARAEEYFAVHGPQTVFIGRFAFGLKNYVPLIAGTSCMPVRQFQFYTLLGAMAYTTLIMGVGYLIGENLQAALALIAQIGYLGALAIVLFGGALFIGHRRRQRS